MTYAIALLSNLTIN